MILEETYPLLVDSTEFPNNAALSKRAEKTLQELQLLRSQYKTGLSETFHVLPKKEHWQRDEGLHGGGNRLLFESSDAINAASLNISCVHYQDISEKRLASANALSAIVHPTHPLAPSMHMHISWTELKDDTGYFRMMADLNPSQPHDMQIVKQQTSIFQKAIRVAVKEDELFDKGTTAGDKYFYIPTVKRHRGAFHFYLEGHYRNFDEDLELAKSVGRAAIDSYLAAIEMGLKQEATETSIASQLEYHTLYLFQVLTLDRGTTSGLLVHDQNDVGIMGSLPRYVDTDLLQSKVDKISKVKKPLLVAIIDILKPLESAGSAKCEVTKTKKAKLAKAVRDFYKQTPEALQLQASGDVIPPTTQNHK